MRDDRWEEISSLFNRALECPDERRPAFLAVACGGDDALRQEVLSLLENHAAAQQFLNGGAAQVVSTLIEQIAGSEEEGSKADRIDPEERRNASSGNRGREPDR
jgi:hypothetical protein